MSNEIEIIDRKRRKILGLYLVFLIIFFVTWMTRFVLRETGALSAVMNRVAIGVLVTALAVKSYAILALNKIRACIAKAPELQEALDNELVRHYREKSWKFAYLAVMGCLVLFAVFNFVSPIKDFFAVVLTAFWAGVVGYLYAFYQMEKS
jgi:hypothetical protein